MNALEKLKRAAAKGKGMAPMSAKAVAEIAAEIFADSVTVAEPTQILCPFTGEYRQPGDREPVAIEPRGELDVIPRYRQPCGPLPQQGPWRWELRPNAEPVPTDADGRIDPNAVTLREAGAILKGLTS